MIRMKNFKLKIENKKPVITGSVSWRGKIHTKLFDLYVIWLKLLKLADWNTLDDTLKRRLKQACYFEVINYLDNRILPLCQLFNIAEMRTEMETLLGSNDLTAEKFIDAVDKNSKRKNRYDCEELIHRSSEADSYVSATSEHSAFTIFQFAISHMDDPDDKIKTDWSETKCL